MSEMQSEVLVLSAQELGGSMCLYDSIISTKTYFCWNIRK